MRGKKTGGRRPGSLNKNTVAIKTAVLRAFEGIGGVPALIKWARDHQTEFYTKIAPRLIPTEMVAGDGEQPLSLRIVMTDAQTASDAE